MDYENRLQELEAITIEGRDLSILRSLRGELDLGNLVSGSLLEEELIRLEKKYLSTTELSILRSVVPETEIESITFESTDNGKLSVKVIYSIFDVVEGDAISQFFDHIEYEKYFIVNTRLKFGQNEDVEVSVIGEQTEHPAQRRWWNRRRRRPNRSLRSRGSLISSSTDTNITKYKFEKKYELDKEPENMSFIVATSFDIAQMERDYDLDLFVLNNDESKKTKELVILSNGNLQYPIQDFRARQELVKFSLSEERKEAFSWLTQKIERKRRLDRDNSTDFFSDFWLTRNAQGEAKFVFIFDIESFFEKRSEYKDFYSRMNNLERRNLKREIIIPSLRVMRKRVKVLQGKHGRSVVDFSDEYTMKKVIETSKLKNRESFLKSVTEDGSLMQINISGVSDKDLMFLTGTDYDIETVTDGTYAYGVFVEIVDTMKNYLVQKIDSLRKETALLKRIHRDSIESKTIKNGRIIKDYDSQTNLYTRPLKEIVNTSFASAAIAVKDVYQLFAETPINTYSDTSRGRQRTFLRTDIKNKINSLFDIDNIKSPEELEMLIEIMEALSRNSLSRIGEPSGGVKGRTGVSASDIKITSGKFYTTPDMIFDANIPKLTGIDYLSNTANVDTSDVIKEINSLAKNVGDIGVKVIDGAVWEDRFLEEINKFFPSGSTSVNIPITNNGLSEDNSVSLTGTGSEFFTMSLFGTGKSANQSNPPLLFGGMKKINTEAFKIIRENLLQGEMTEEAKFFSSFGVVTENSEQNVTLLNEDAGNTDTQSKSSRSPDKDISADFKNTDMTFQERQEKRDFEKFIFSKMSAPLNSPMLGTNNMFAPLVSRPDPLETAVAVFSEESNFPGSRTLREDIEAAPNQVIAYSMANLGDSAGYVVSESFLTKIEFLTGFETDSNAESVSIPIWEGLTIDAYKKNTDKNLLCRIKPYYNERLGVRTARTNKPIYDSVFIIKPIGTFTYEYVEQSETDFGSNEAMQTALEIAREKDRQREQFQRQVRAKRREVDNKRDEIKRLEMRDDAIGEEILELQNIVANFERNRRRGDELNPRVNQRMAELTEESLGITYVRIPRVREEIEIIQREILELQKKINSI